MPKFKFRLKTVLEVKELKKKQSVVDYVELSRYLEIQDQMLSGMKNKSAEIADLLTHEASKGITAAEIKTHSAFLRRIDKDIKNQSRVVNDIHKEKQNLQASLFKLHNEVRVLESLRQRRQLDFHNDLAKQEEKRVDEFVTYTLSSI